MLLIARHGETAWSEPGRLISRTDLPLTADGIAQARTLAEALARVTLGEIRTSPAQRARRTAELVGAAQVPPLTPAVDDRLREVDLGPFEGHTPRELVDGPLAEAFARWRTDPPTFAPGMETYEAAAVRVGGVVAETSIGTGVVLLVTHAYLARIAIASLTGMPLANVRRLRLDYGRIAVVRWEDALPRLAGLNLDTFWLSSRP